MGLFGLSKSKPALEWNDLSSVAQIAEIEKESAEIPVLILKHSTRCSISAMAKNRLELYWDKEVALKPYYLDLLSHRDVSNALAEKFKVEHQSPQILLIKNGQCVYHASHTEIDYNTLKRYV